MIIHISGTYIFPCISIEYHSGIAICYSSINVIPAAIFICCYSGITCIKYSIIKIPPAVFICCHSGIAIIRIVFYIITPLTISIQLHSCEFNDIFSIVISTVIVIIITIINITITGKRACCIRHIIIYRNKKS